MKLVQVVNGQPQEISLGILRQQHPNVSFPRELPPEGLPEFNVYLLVDSEKPSTSSLSKDYTYTLVFRNGRYEKNWTLTDLPAAQAKQNFERALTKELDEFARTKGYDNIMSASTYAAGGRYAIEGRRALDLRSDYWYAAGQILQAVEAGQRAMPESLEDIRGELPTLSWT